MVAQRAELGKNFGVVLVPEGLVEFMHDVSALIAGAGRLPPPARTRTVTACGPRGRGAGALPPMSPSPDPLGGPSATVPSRVPMPASAPIRSLALLLQS